MSTTTALTTQVYRVYIKAEPQAIWDAITKPEWNSRFGYGGLGEYDLRPGGRYEARASEEMFGGRHRRPSPASTQPSGSRTPASSCRPRRR